MGKGILVVGLVLYGAMDVVAQSVTYSHDAAKMNQITSVAQVVQQECGEQEQTVVPYPCRGEPV